MNHKNDRTQVMKANPRLKLSVTERQIFKGYWDSEKIEIIGSKYNDKGYRPPLKALSSFFWFEPWETILSYENDRSGSAWLYFDVDNHWFGLFADAMGYSYPVTYELKSNGKAIVRVVNNQFNWHDGDQFLSDSIIMPLLFVEIFSTGLLEIYKDKDQRKVMSKRLKNYKKRLLNYARLLHTYKAKTSRDGYIGMQLMINRSMLK